MQNLRGQTKSIMVFSEVAYYNRPFFFQMLLLLLCTTMHDSCQFSSEIICRVKIERPTAQIALKMISMGQHFWKNEVSSSTSILIFILMPKLWLQILV